ncbi:hypothetical protein [Polaribacter butkevichii]|nr:hypothetical protein [Polaribacter butkevichii]
MKIALRMNADLLVWLKTNNALTGIWVRNKKKGTLPFYKWS